MGKERYTQAILSQRKPVINVLMQQSYGNITVTDSGALFSIKYMSTSEDICLSIHLTLEMKKKYNRISYDQIEDFVLSDQSLMEKRIGKLIQDEELRLLSLHIKELV